MIGTDGFQETPIVEVTRQITKHNYLVLDVNDLPRIMKEVRLHYHLLYCFAVQHGAYASSRHHFKRSGAAWLRRHSVRVW